MTKKHKLTLTLEFEDNWWVISIPKIGVFTEGETERRAFWMLGDALVGVMELYKDKDIKVMLAKGVRSARTKKRGR